MTNLDKLKAEIGKNIFVVSIMRGVMRTSDHGKLENVNEPNNIVIALRPFGEHVIPLDNGSDKILKVYNKQGYVVYDNEK